MTEEVYKTIKLNSREFDLLLVALGYATGAASREGKHQLAIGFMKLANIVNKDNPDWIPYKFQG